MLEVLKRQFLWILQALPNVHILLKELGKFTQPSQLSKVTLPKL